MTLSPEIEKALKYITFVCVMIAGVILVIISVATKHYEYLALLPFCLFGGISGLLYAAQGRPSGTYDPPGTGGKFLGLPDGITIIDGTLLALGIIAIIIVQAVS
jgi:hypothetical protein